MRRMATTLLLLVLALPAGAQEIECLDGYFVTDESGGLQAESLGLESRAVRATMIGPFLNVMFDDNEDHLTSTEVPAGAQTFHACTNGEVTFQIDSTSAYTQPLERPWLDAPVVEEPIMDEGPSPEEIIPWEMPLNYFVEPDTIIGPK